MTDFPRGAGALSRIATPPRFPGASQSWGQSGKGQIRSMQNMGRMWTETYPTLDTAKATVRALMAALNQSLRSGPTWQVQHPYWHIRNGLGGGVTIQVNGANQTGTSLLIKGATPSVVGWLKAGDMIQVTGCPVVFDVEADVNTDGAGHATVTINPPIFSGQSPADSAAIQIDPTLIKFNVIVTDVSDYPGMDVTRYIDPGMTVTFREQPQ